MTLDADTEALIRGEAARTGASFKGVLNQAVRRALGPRAGRQILEPLFAAPFPAGLSEMNFNRLATEWEDEDTNDADFSRFPGLEWENPLVGDT